jgi:membrane protein
MAQTLTRPEVADRGRAADSPKEISKRGWKDVFFRLKAEMKDDQLTFLSGGVAFFTLIALVPAMVALVSIFGLVADPADVQQQVRDSLTSAPTEVRQLVESQLEGITRSSGTGLGIGVAVGVVLALWSASAGMVNLIAALNRVYDENETRKFFKLRATALGLTLGAIVFVAAGALLITLLPEDNVISLIRWPLLAIGFIAGLGIVYRVGPDRRDARWQWVTPGAVFATVLWLLVSIAFSLYTSNFGKYNETYGALGAVVVTMLWLQLTALAILLGAELNAEMEHQTRKDTTTGSPQPMGQRGAEMADTVGPTAEEVKAAS